MVGTVHSPGSLRKARRLPAGAIDLVEIRLDALVQHLDLVRETITDLAFPIIITVRAPAEGGLNGLRKSQRAALYAEFLPHGRMIDVELRSAASFGTTTVAARRNGVAVILSSHFFSSSPRFQRLRQLVTDAAHHAGDICKIAALTNRIAALIPLLRILARPSPIPLSIMGMGSFGQASRLILANAGSVLNYGYLDTPNAPGQWEATLLKKRLTELRFDAG